MTYLGDRTIQDLVRLTNDKDNLDLGELARYEIAKRIIDEELQSPRLTIYVDKPPRKVKQLRKEVR